MIIEYIRYTISPEKQAYKQAETSLQKSPHCLGYELSQCTEETQSYILRIEWVSIEGHLPGFRASPEFREFFAAVRPYVSDIAEMRHYNSLLSYRGK